jgi:DNA-3-methyladenine glycosylase
MFGPPGVAYVYLIYGMYEMLNFVTEPKAQAGAVLIRALDPCAAEVAMMRQRSKGRAAQAKPLRRQELASGPGKLCRALGIQLSDNGTSLQGPRLTVEDDGYLPERVSISPRVGITAGTDRFWRFFISGHPCVSRAPQNAQARVLRRGMRG